MIDNGRFGSVTELAEALRVDRSYVRRIMRLALLAPDIVDAILSGKEPSGLSLERLTKEMPTAWDEQRKNLEFSSPLPNQERQLQCRYDSQPRSP